jgi:hypothetical protein
MELVPRVPARSLEELLDGATAREPLGGTDGKSGAVLERVVIDGEPFVLKQVHVDHDWTMRGLGDVCCRPTEVWTSGLLDAMPDCIHHAVVRVATGLGRNGWGGALLLEDVGEHLFPEGDDPIGLEPHRLLLDHLAEVSATFWGTGARLPGEAPISMRYTIFNPSWLAAEEARGWPDPVPPIAHKGWAQFATRAPSAVLDAITALRTDVDPLVAALATTPSTFLHGDWKMGNLGMRPEGRTVLLDWTYPGDGPVLHELGWYLALNAARLPEPKEDAIDALRSSLERHGVATAEWWDRQLDLCLLGTLVQFGWEKALGEETELAWWCDRAAAGIARL